MSFWKCPGQDQSFWRPEDVFEIPCPYCGYSIEFWKNDVTRNCSNCKQQINNPRFDPGCAAWCSYAEKCIGERAKEIKNQPQAIRNRLQRALRNKLSLQDGDLFNRALKEAREAEKTALAEKKDPLITVAASMVGPVARDKDWSREEILSLLEETGIDQNTAEKIYQRARVLG